MEKNILIKRLVGFWRDRSCLVLRALALWRKRDMTRDCLEQRLLQANSEEKEKKALKITRRTKRKERKKAWEGNNMGLHNCNFLWSKSKLGSLESHTHTQKIKVPRIMEISPSWMKGVTLTHAFKYILLLPNICKQLIFQNTQENY